MENLVKIENNQMVLDSREVAEMVGMRHADLMRNIDHYIEVISTERKLAFVRFFRREHL